MGRHSRPTEPGCAIGRSMSDAYLAWGVLLAIAFFGAVFYYVCREIWRGIVEAKKEFDIRKGKDRDLELETDPRRSVASISIRKTSPPPSPWFTPFARNPSREPTGDATEPIVIITPSVTPNAWVCETCNNNNPLVSDSCVICATRRPSPSCR